MTGLGWQELVNVLVVVGIPAVIVGAVLAVVVARRGAPVTGGSAAAPTFRRILESGRRRGD